MIVRLENPSPELMPDVFRWHLGEDLPTSNLVGLAHMAGDMSGAQVAAVVRSARSKARAALRFVSFASSSVPSLGRTLVADGGKIPWQVTANTYCSFVSGVLTPPYC
jgi:hypothetical protein